MEMIQYTKGFTNTVEYESGHHTQGYREIAMEIDYNSPKK